MSPRWNRRDVLKGFLAASGSLIVRPPADAAAAPPPEPQIEIQVTPVSSHTFRLSILPVNGGSLADIPSDGSLVEKSWGNPIAKLRADTTRTVSAGDLRLKISFQPLSIEVTNLKGDVIQELVWDEKRASFPF